MNNAALIFSHSITPRLQYTVDFLSQYYGLPFGLTSDEEKFRQASEVCKINYSYHRIIPGEMFIHSHVLLFESSVREVKIECFEQDGHKAFFKAEGDTGFDLFAAVFYLLSRYEEYRPHQKDMYGRYAHHNALAFREGFLQLPLINLWLEQFRNALAEKNSAFSIPHTPFAFQPTYDIDMAWSFLHKGFTRNAGALLLLLLKGKWGSAMHRLRVLRRKASDPFDAYAWMESLHQKHTAKPLYFFLVAEEKGKYDKNIDVKAPAFQELIQSLALQNQLGLHPSWASGDHPSLLKKEKKTLEELSGIAITASRQHFIRMQLPSTYQQLLSAGIAHDYSMGYGSINGFRASIASPFYWYDLKKEEATNLLVHPFCFMDANAYYEEKLSPAGAQKELQQYLSITRKVNGTLITVWHNSFLGTAKEFAGWREVYADFFEKANE